MPQPHDAMEQEAGEETTIRQPMLPDAALGLDRCMELRLGRVQDPGGAYPTPRPKW